jgi:dihydroflavonol-4-reductase
VIVQPGAVSGPGDHSQLGNMIDQTRKGRMPFLMFPDSGFNFVHVDDVAEGIVLALDKGEVGQSYVLGGEIATLGDFIKNVAVLSDRKPPKRELPPALIKASAPLGPVIGPLMGFPSNLKELIRSSAGVTVWAKHDKAERELGYSPRGLETGLRQTLEAS